MPGLLSGVESAAKCGSTADTCCINSCSDGGVCCGIGQDNKFYTLNGQSESLKAQVICSDCNHIQDIDAPFMEWYGKTVAEKLD